MAPSPNEAQASTVRPIVILRVHIKEAHLTHKSTSRILRQRADVEDAQTGAVIALVCEAVDDELVVVRAVAGGLEVAGLLGVAEVADVPEVGDGEAVAARAGTADLVVLVVEDEELLPGGVCDPALVDVWSVLRQYGGVFEAERRWSQRYLQFAPV
jgi:hypothetical protein